jgi:hypothetical protein
MCKSTGLGLQGVHQFTSLATELRNALSFKLPSIEWGRETSFYMYFSSFSGPWHTICQTGSFATARDSLNIYNMINSLNFA